MSTGLTSAAGPQESPSPTVMEMTTTGSPPTDPPLSVILASAIVGGLALLALIVISLVLLCFINRRDKQGKRKASAPTASAENGNGQVRRPDARSRPLYAQLFRSSTRRDSSKKQKSKDRSAVKVSVPVQHPLPRPTVEDYPQPEEIAAFGFDVPRTFRPFAPPPRNTASLHREEHQNWPYNQPTDGHYDFLESTEGTANGFTQSLQIPAYPGTNPRVKPNKPLPQPRHTRALPQLPTIQADSLTASLNVSIHPVRQESIQSESSESDYQYPRPTTLPRRGKYLDSNQIYSEHLDPAMFDQGGEQKRKVSQALPYPPIYDRPKPVIASDQPTEVTRRHIVEIQDLGMGRFGGVVLAATTGLSLKDLKLGDNDDKCRSLLVAIKKLREDADSTLIDTFQTEIKFMSKLKHANVARLLGVCSTGENFLMMEYMEKGDLHEFLQKQTMVPDTVDALGEEEITPLVLLYMGVQVASGMRYLAKKKFVHRDLATRNCLVGRDFIVKISDFGMSRNLYESSYYLVQGKLILPIRWMAYESFYGKFSSSSDAWSFAVTLWEIYTLAKLDPYYELSDEEYIADTMKGERRRILEKPEKCPKEVHDVMQRCWIHDPTMRADFEEIYSRLFLVYTKLSKPN